MKGKFASVSESECVQAAVPDGVSLPSSRTLVMQSVLNRMKEHGRSSLSREVCGVLVGRLCREPQTSEAYLSIEGSIEGLHAECQAGSVTFTSGTWDHIHAEMEKRYPDRRIVGWYHTHPSFGIFLSGMDTFIQENFFGEPWQTAYVYDPQADTDGFFFWQDGDIVPGTVAVVPDAEPLAKRVAASSRAEAEALQWPVAALRWQSVVLGLMVVLESATLLSSLWLHWRLGSLEQSDRPVIRFYRASPDSLSAPSLPCVLEPSADAGSAEPERKERPSEPADDEKPTDAPAEPAPQEKR
ncbi:MAG: Mov34/MPN/PAD-1 family protein [Oligosphaeraceae bacterium]